MALVNTTTGHEKPYDVLTRVVVGFIGFPVNPTTIFSACWLGA